MTSKIHNALPQTKAPSPRDSEGPLQPPKTKQMPVSKKEPALSVPPTRDLRHLGKELMKRERGEDFSFHYHAACEAAGALRGKEFLQQYRSLKRIARTQGISEEEFRRYEKCLYQQFYRAAAKDIVRARQSGLTPKVMPDELAYIAKVADISEEQIHRDALTFQKCEFVARILDLKTRRKGWAA